MFRKNLNQICIDFHSCFGVRHKEEKIFQKTPLEEINVSRVYKLNFIYKLLINYFFYLNPKNLYIANLEK